MSQSGEPKEDSIRLAMNIVNQLGDMWAVPVDDRQNTNDKADEFVARLVQAHTQRQVIEALESLIEEGETITYNADIYERIAELKKPTPSSNDDRE